MTDTFYFIVGLVIVFVVGLLVAVGSAIAAGLWLALLWRVFTEWST